MGAKGFENTKNQIGYCGIWCGSCMGGNGAFQELTRKYEQIAQLSKYALEKYAPEGFNFDELMKNLASAQAMPQCPGCKKGGGNSTCSVRICASQRNIASCGECNELTSCGNFEELEKNYPHMKEDLVKIKSVGQKKMIAKWIDELRGKWPHCVLLCEAADT